MERTLHASVGANQNNSAYGWQGHALAFSGRVDAAHEQFARGTQLALQGGFKEVAGQLTVEDAEAHALVGQCTQARKEIAEGLELTRDNFSLERASRALVICGAEREGAALADDLEKRFSEATLTMRVSVPLVTALVALENNEPARAIDVLEPLRPLDRAPKAVYWPEYLRGLSYLKAHAGDKAKAEFERILDHRGEDPYSQLYALAHLGLARATASMGDQNGARDAYEHFLALWNEADPDLAPIKEARRELARLKTR
jgi:tetratricopeptide (TPR) repeat protein